MNRTEKKYFNRIKKVMQEAGIFADADAVVVEHAAITLSLIEEAKRLVEQNGQVQEYSTGARQISPEVNNLRGLMADFLKYSAALGLSPAARKRLDISPKEEVKETKVSIMRLAK